MLALWHNIGNINKGKGRKTHGLTGTKTYRAWYHMKGRCYNKNDKDYKNYGGRGICVCLRWLDPKNGFENFLNDMGECPNGFTLDKKNNNGDYCADNCRWATHIEQNRNRRSNILITYNGLTKCAVEWGLEFGLTGSRITNRLRRGWSIKKALMTKPARRTPEERKHRLRIQQRVHNALCSGRLVRPNCCDKCKLPCYPYAYHYLGYSDEHTLDVKWLCRKCRRSYIGPDDE